MSTSVAYRQPHHDPYDLWSLPAIGRWKLRAQDGRRFEWVLSGVVAVADSVAPRLLRKLLGVPARRYAHTAAMLFMAQPEAERAPQLLELAREQRISSGTGWAWGYPFDWYSRNAPGGVYRASSLPFVTISTYVMEALLQLRVVAPSLAEGADELFDGTWGFLEDLVVLEETPQTLSLSYAPVREPLKIVNASTYAALGYALHARFGKPERQRHAQERVRKLVAWVVAQQRGDGRFYYLADSSPLNFIDTFHTCLVVRNLNKVCGLLPELRELHVAAIDSGFAYLQAQLFDRDRGLCRRFAESTMKDPLYRWDIYDQAEYLGLLVDFGRLEQAAALVQTVERTFGSAGRYACRVNFLGQRWGHDHMRWGIAPYLYQRARFERTTGARG